MTREELVGDGPAVGVLDDDVLHRNPRFSCGPVWLKKCRGAQAPPLETAKRGETLGAIKCPATQHSKN